MASNLKRLQDRGAAIAAKMTELASVEARSDEQTAELRRLSTEADAVKADLKFEEEIAAKEAELRAVVEKAAPAPEPKPEPKKDSGIEVRHLVPDHRSLKVFNSGKEDVEQAYRYGRWLAATIAKRDADVRWCRDNGLEFRALNEGSNSSGGALFPDEFAARVIRNVETYGTFPGACENVNMARDTMVIPKRVSGTTSYFVGEGTAITESEPTYANVSLVAKKLACATRWSSEVAEDTAGYVNLADQVVMEFGTDLAYKIDICGWNGTGTQATYGGINGIVNKIDDGTHTASVISAASGNTAFETLDMEDFLKCMGKLPIYARAGARWYISPAGYAASMARLKYALGGNDVSDGSAAPGFSFLGYPVTLVHVMNSTLGADASKIKCLFGNMALSSIYARRRDFSVKLYDQVYATTDQLLLQGTMRFDIAHHSLGSTSEVGPVVALKTPGS